MRGRCDQGTVFAEFLIAFPIIFVLFLAVIQLALIGAARLVVQHAAYRAARELSLVADEDPAEVEGAPRMIVRVAGNYRNGSSVEDGPRLKRVKEAAHTPLLAFAPAASVSAAWASGTTPSLESGALSSDGSRALVGLAFTEQLTDVALTSADPGANVLGTSRQVTVTYQHLCTVPIASALICKSLIEVPGSDAIQRMLGFELPRLLELRGQAVATFHHANYRYRSEHGDG